MKKTVYYLPIFDVSADADVQLQMCQRFRKNFGLEDTEVMVIPSRFLEGFAEVKIPFNPE